MDSMERVEALDRRQMLNRLGEMPKHFSDGLREGRLSKLPKFVPRNLFVCGMGGSAIGGDLLREWLSITSDFPCTVVRSYSVPASVTKDSLVIVASYSGETEETISMFESARKRGAKIVIATSGGTLARTADAEGLPYVKLPSGLVPRASLGFMLGAMVGIVERAGIMASEREMEETMAVLSRTARENAVSVRTADNPAKKMAHGIIDKVPVVVGYGLSVPVARRWANQFNENSKCLAFSSELPELDHNEIVGWALDPRSMGFVALFLDHRRRDRTMERRLAATKDMISKRAQVITVEALGQSPLAQIMSLVLFGDYVSAYLGILRGFDPSSTEPIDELKSVLSKK